MNEPRVVESVTNECQSLGRAHESSSARAEQLIACLEGEIAKRDARIVELESRYQRDVYGLNNEGDPIGGDPAGGYANDNARLRSELAAIKAQGVVMPRNIEKSFLEWASAQLKAPTQLAAYMAGADEVARINASHVQRVSVPDASTDFSQFLSAVMDAAGLVRHGRRSKELSEYLGSKCMEYRCFAAPAAPAADAWLVEALSYQALFDAIAAATSVYANGAINISVQAFRDALAAHRAKGVV